MPCETCGCIIMDYLRDISLVEDCQLAINQLYKQNPVPKDMVDSLKTVRDQLLERVLSFLARYSHDLRRQLLRDRAIPIDWDTEERFEGEENAIADVYKEEPASICSII